MNTPTTFQTVIEHFKRNGWNFQIHPDRPLLHAGFRGKHGNFRCVAAVDEPDDLLQVVSFLPFVVPPDKLAAAAELCARLSYGMKMGRFELDPANGDLRFHTYGAYPKGELKDAVVHRVLGVNLAMVDLHFPAFISVIYGNVSPAEAARQVRTGMVKGATASPAPAIQTPSRISFN